MKIKNFKCPQCGSTDFEREKKLLVRCAYCDSLFEVSGKFDENRGSVIVNKGAKVIIGKNANVEIGGSLEIEDGAEVTILGKITMLKKGNDEKIKLARKKLKKIEEGKS